MKSASMDLFKETTRKKLFNLSHKSFNSKEKLQDCSVCLVIFTTTNHNTTKKLGFSAKKDMEEQ